MATAIVVFHQAGNRSVERESMPVIKLPGARAEVVSTNAATSVQTTLNSNALNPSNVEDGGFATVVAGSANLWVDCGPNPVSAKPTTGNNGTGFPIYANTKETFAIGGDHEISLIEWT